MFNYHDFPRTMSRAQWTEMYHIIRKVGDRPPIHDESQAAARASLAAHIATCVEDGAICIVESGMDCDCVQYCHASVIPNPGVMSLLAREQDSYYWADGPMSIGYCRPSERPDNYSRDLALEAFEEGRPHYITTATV